MKAVGKKFITSPLGFITVYGYVKQNESGSANGNGKTTWAQAIINESLENGVTSLYVNARDMMAFLKGGIGDYDFDVEQRLQIIIASEVLVIDELSAINWTPWVEDQITTILDTRYKLFTQGVQRGTIIILDESYKQLHQRIVSRIENGTIIRNIDTDMRPSFGQKLL